MWDQVGHSARTEGSRGAIRHRRLHQAMERLGHAVVSFLLLLRLG